MPLMPIYEQDYSSWELAGWRTLPSGLEGKIITLDELKHLFPADENNSEIEALKDSTYYTIYGRRKGLIGKYSVEERLACLCKSCNNLILGPPNIVEVNTLGPLSGREGCDMYCCHCNSYLYDFTFKCS